MPSFEQILQHSLVAHAARQEQAANRLGATIGSSGFAITELSKDVKRGVTPEAATQLPVWHWETKEATPNLLTSVTAAARGMDFHRMGVLDALSLDKVTITPVNGTTVTLDLTSSFVAARRHLYQGRIAENSVDLYPLEAKLDKSLLHAFAYNFKDGFASPPAKCTEAELASDSFMPAPAAGASPSRVCTGDRVVLKVGTPRVVVIWSVAFCKERADFEPGGILGAGRVLPHVLVMANVPLKEVTAHIRFKRPSQMNHEMPGMNAPIRASLFLDSNEGRSAAGLDIDIAGAIAASPYWHDLFDAYQAPARPSTYRAVDPQEKGGTLRGAIKRLKQVATPVNGGAVPAVTYSPGYVEGEVLRVPRQGAFDNIHAAPSMKATIADAARFHADTIYMAPFCEHDCFHLHWRWGAYHLRERAFGFSDTPCGGGLVPGTPYATAGAPMVPPNQTVNIRVLNSAEWVYEASAHAPTGMTAIAPGTLSLFCHHGGAYGLAIVNETLVGIVESQLKVLALARNEPLAGESAYDPAMRYWRLRYGGTAPNSVMERLVTVDEAKLLGRTTS